MLTVGCRKGIRPVKTEWWGDGVVICLERGAELHMAQLMPLSLTVSCFSEVQTGFTFLVLAHSGSHEQRAIKWVCVCVCKISTAFFCYRQAEQTSDLSLKTELLLHSYEVFKETMAFDAFCWNFCCSQFRHYVFDLPVMCNIAAVIGMVYILLLNL